MTLQNLLGDLALDASVQELVDALTTLNATLTVQPLTDTQLRATPVPVTSTDASTGTNQTTANAIAQDTDDTLILLRRILHMTRAMAVVDSSLRQRVAVEALPRAVIGTSLAAGGNGPSIGAPTVVATLDYQPVWEGPVDQRWRIKDAARTNYAVGIRANLIFS